MPSATSITALLPLIISGYFFNLIFYPTRYFCVRVDGQRLFFISAGTGLLLGATSFVLSALLKQTIIVDIPIIALCANFIGHAVPFPHAVILLFCIIFSVLLACFLNTLLRLYCWATENDSAAGARGRETAKKVYSYFVQKHGTPLAQLLRTAAEKEKLVMVSLKSRKFYCGRILEVPTNLDSESAFVEMLPRFSGYRDKDTLKMGKEKTDYPAISAWLALSHRETRRDVLIEFEKYLPKLRKHYPDSYAFLDNEHSQYKQELEDAISAVKAAGIPNDFDINDWVKVITVKEIESATFFDEKLYDSWFSAPKENGTPDSMDNSEPRLD